MVTFPYIKRQDVRVYIDGTPIPTSQYEWVSDTEIKITASVSMGLKVVLRRFTRKDARWADYYDGSVLGEGDLNIVTLQLLYLIQELYDYGVAGDGGDPIPGGPGGGEGDPSDPNGDSLIEQIINDLLSSQLFQDLIALIDLVDINAEVTMHNSLLAHDQWRLNGQRQITLDNLDQSVGDNAALIVQNQNAILTESTARTTLETILTARIDGNAADIVDTMTAVTDLESATASQFTLISARFDSNESSIAFLQTAQATTDSAIATMQTELDATIRDDELETLLAQSNYIEAIQVQADQNTADGTAIRSLVVGVGADPFDPETWVNGSLAKSVSVVQETVEAHSDQLGTEASFRTALASVFSAPDPENPSTLATAISTTMTTRAEEAIAASERISRLETNDIPIFFRTVAPDWTTPEFVDTYWSTAGFPEGSLWWRKIGNGLYVPYSWVITSTEPSGNTYSYGNFGPYNGVDGMWIEVLDKAAIDARGALIQTVENTYVREDEVGARVETQLQAVYGNNYAAINETLETFVRPPAAVDPEDPESDEVGLLYSTYNLRINQTDPNGVPVIAGFGLGMQRDLANPEATTTSQFIVMANQFGVINPPAGVDLIEGPIDTANMVVPFIIDATTSTVGINGKLLVNGTLGAYDGSMGRLQMGEVNADGELIDPTGIRLVLPSSTEGFWNSTALSPFTGNAQKFLIWAGTGAQNHNNAIFYVDTDGNAKFDGFISAANVNGIINDILAIQTTGGSGITMVNGDTGIKWSSNVHTIPANGQPRNPIAHITLSTYNTAPNYMTAYLQMKVGAGAWNTVATVPNVFSNVGYQTGTDSSGDTFSILTPSGADATVIGSLGYSTTESVSLRVGLSYDGSGNAPNCLRYGGSLSGIR